MGANQGRVKGNKQKAKYQKPEKKHGKPGGKEGGKRGSRKDEPKHCGSHCEAEAGSRERKKQRLSSEMLKAEADERKRKPGTGPGDKIKRGSPVEQLRERSREGRKETNRKPSTKTGKECMRNQAGKNGENRRSESGSGAPEKPL